MILKRKINPQGYDAVVFDCDSTLSAIEGIDLLAEKHEQKELVESITHRAMNGHSSFAEALALRLDIVRPCKEDIYWLGHEYIKNVVPETRELIGDLRKNNKEVYIISGGFEIAIKIFAKYINIDESNVFSNVLIFNALGEYQAFDKHNPLARNHGKKKILKELAKNKSILFVGDGITDLEAKEDVDLFVGFGGVKVRNKVKDEADIFIEAENLSEVKYIALGKSSRSALENIENGANITLRLNQVYSRI